MFETLDDQSPSRIPGKMVGDADPDDMAPAWGMRVASAVVGAGAYYAQRFPAGSDASRDVVSWLLMGVALWMFLAFEYQAYRERQDGPIDITPRR